MTTVPFMLGPNYHELNRLVAADAFELQAHIRNTLRLLRPQTAKGQQKVRLGAADDGFVMLDDFEVGAPALMVGSGSKGLTEELQRRGLAVERIGGMCEDLTSPTNGRNFEHFARSFMAAPAEHKRILIIQLAGGEWEFLNSVPLDCLSYFSQIVCTFSALDRISDLQWRQTYFKVLRKLSKHHAVVHVHGDNRSEIANVCNVTFPKILEITFANRSTYEFSDGDEIFPGPLDGASDLTKPDLFLGSFRYEAIGDSGQPIAVEPVSWRKAKTAEANEWQDRADAATARRNRLLSFGPQAIGLLAATQFGPMVVDAEDGSVGATLLSTGNYAEDEYLFARSLVRPDRDILVVGAHIGAHVVRLAKDCRELVAIEANPRTYPLLEANVQLQHCSNVALLNVAAGEKDGAIEFMMNRDNTGGSKRKPVQDQVFYTYDNPDIIEVPCRRLDDLLGANREFDLIFMDIEGSEYFALQGMQSLLRGCRALSVEFLVHHLRDVAAANIDQFSSLIVPHFECLFIPGPNVFVGAEQMAGKLAQMYRDGENRDCVYFLKEAGLVTTIGR